MNITKYICVLLLSAILLSAVGCGESETKTNNGTFLELKNPPSAVADVTDQTVYKRFNDAYTTSLIASKEYGELVPFVGAYYQYKINDKKKTDTKQMPLYGLCTVDGRVVVDPVYDDVVTHFKKNGGFIYELIVGADRSVDNKGQRFIAASDGSWVFKCPKNCKVLAVANDGIMFERTKTVKKVTTVYYDFYGFNGKKVFTFDTAVSEDKEAEITIGHFSEGFAAVNITKKQDDTDKVTKEAYYMDAKGKKVFETVFTYCGDFTNGYAVVVDEQGLYGVINTLGEYFINPQYRIINRNIEKGYYACAAEGYFEILDSTAVVVKKVFVSKSNVEVLNSDSLIYKKTNPDTGRSEYFYADGDKPFTCKATGQFPDSDISVGGFYYCSYGGTAEIFNEQGETVATVHDFGKLKYRCGDVLVAVNKNDNKTCIISLNDGKCMWLDLQCQNQVLFDRYIVLKSDEKGYAIYDTLAESFVYEGCEFLDVKLAENSSFVTLVNGDRYILLDSALNTILNISSDVRH